MTPEQKQTELLRYKTLLLATLDYLDERFGASFILDRNSWFSEYYQQQKVQTEKYLSCVDWIAYNSNLRV